MAHRDASGKLRGLLADGGRPLLTGRWVGAVVVFFWSGVFGVGHSGEDPGVGWFLDTVPDVSAATGWLVRRQDLRVASGRMGNSAPGLDGVPYAFWWWGGAGWSSGAIFEVLRSVGRDIGGSSAM